MVHEFDPRIISRYRITSHFSFGGRGQGAPAAVGDGCACARVRRGWVCACVAVCGQMRGIAECARSGTRQTPSLPGVRTEALGKFSFFSFFLFLLFHNIFFKIYFYVL